MMTSPQILSCQKQQAFWVPSLLFKPPNTFLRPHRPGARSRAGHTCPPAPGSPSLLPTLPASHSHTSRTQTLNKEEAVKMERRIRWLWTHSPAQAAFLHVCLSDDVDSLVAATRQRKAQDDGEPGHHAGSPLLCSPRLRCSRSAPGRPAEAAALPRPWRTSVGGPVHPRAWVCFLWGVVPTTAVPLVWAQMPHRGTPGEGHSEPY